MLSLSPLLAVQLAVCLGLGYGRCLVLVAAGLVVARPAPLLRLGVEVARDLAVVEGGGCGGYVVLTWWLHGGYVALTLRYPR